MIRQFCFAAVAVLLVSCSTFVDGQIQDVTIETQGAENTLCYMQNKDFSFRFYPPQTLKVTKSRDPYTIRCLAPGNREKTVTVAPKVTDTTFFNAANLGTGVALDHLSASMYELPSRIVISFEGMIPEGYDQPGYNKFFDKHPELKGLEEFRPGQPALLRDAGTEAPSLKKRDDGAGNEAVSSTSSMVMGSEVVSSPSDSSGQMQAPVPLGSKGMSADSLTRSMNPGVFGGSSAPAATSDPISMSAP